MYDLVLITQLPAFYKVNLYNEIASRLSIKVIFLGKTSDERTPDFVSLSCKFEHSYLSTGDFETRDTFHTIQALRHELKSITYKKILCTGWNLPEFMLVFLTHRREQNLLGLESTIMESSIGGVKGFLKKLLLQRVGTVLASGRLHEQLLTAMDYQGKVIRTLGVGIINRRPSRLRGKVFRKSFLFLGRLAPEKNLERLIKIFNHHPECTLSIVGNGPLRDELKSIANKNISFIAHVPNERIDELFVEHDVLVLPSLREPWGLVVEEALHFNTPVLISNRCGASELIRPGENGLVFDPLSETSLEAGISGFNSESYPQFFLIDGAVLLAQKDVHQVTAYVEATK